MITASEGHQATDRLKGAMGQELLGGSALAGDRPAPRGVMTRELTRGEKKRGATQKSEQYSSVVEYEAGLRRQKKRPIKVQANLARTFPEEAAWSPDMRMFTRKLPYDLALVPPWYPPRS